MCGLLKWFPLFLLRLTPRQVMCHQDWKTGLEGCRHHIQYCLELGFKMCNKIYSSFNITPLPSNKKTTKGVDQYAQILPMKELFCIFLPSLIVSLTPFVVQKEPRGAKNRSRSIPPPNFLPKSWHGAAQVNTHCHVCLLNPYIPPFTVYWKASHRRSLFGVGVSKHCC